MIGTSKYHDIAYKNTLAVNSPDCVGEVQPRYHVKTMIKRMIIANDTMAASLNRLDNIKIRMIGTPSSSTDGKEVNEKPDGELLILSDELSTLESLLDRLMMLCNEFDEI